MKSEFAKFIQQIFQDIDGNYSSKRVVVFLSMLMIIIAFIANLFGGYLPSQFIFDDVFWLVVSGLGISSIAERGFKSFSVTKKIESQTVDKNIDVNVSSDKGG